MSKVCSIIVTYNPNIDEFKSFFEMNRLEVDFNIIVDNSDSLSKQIEVSRFKGEENTEVIQLFENKGIAFAQNVGIKKAELIGSFDFLLFLDQDSMLSKNIVEIYKKSYSQLSNKYKIAALGVGSTNQDNLTNSYEEEVKQIISSGTFSPIDVFKNVGYFDEDLFIDFVEYDWCWRAIDKNFKIFSVKSVGLNHSHGDGKINILGFKMVKPSPIRHYYQYRNFLYMFKNAYTPLAWKLSMLIKMIIKTPLYIILLDKKMLRLKYINKGIMDFIFGEKGKIK